MTRLFSERWQLEGNWFHSALPVPLPPESRLLECRFDADPGIGSFLPITDPELLDRGQRKELREPSRPARVEEGALCFPDDFGIAVLQSPASPLTPYRVTVRLRATPGRQELPFLAISELAAPLPPAFGQDDIERLFARPADSFTRDPLVLGTAPARADVKTETEDRGDGTFTIRYEFVAGFGTRGLLLGLIGGTRAMGGGARDIRFAGLTVDEVPLAAVLGSGLEHLALPNQEQHLDADRRITQVRRDGESRRALLLQAGCVARCRFTAPPAGRLRLGLCIAPEFRLTRKGTVRQRVELKAGPTGAVTPWAEVVELRLDEEEPHLWLDLSVPCAADRAEEWTLEVRIPEPGGAAAPLVALSEPLLLDPSAASGQRSLVVISIDTMRADRLGRVVAGHSITPHLDRLQQASLEFPVALANASYTLPSHVSLFTSQRLREHRVELGRKLDPARSHCVTEVLAEHGFATAAFTAGGMLNPDFCGIERGFDRYGEFDPLLSSTDRMPIATPLMRGGERYNPAVFEKHRLEHTALPFLREHRDVPFFLFVHTYLVHNYQPDEDVAARLGVADAAAESQLGHVTPSVVSRLQLPDAAHKVRRSLPLDRAHDLPYLERLYDATVHQADRAVGQLLDALESAGLRDRTIVVVTSDHGEEFLEHGDLCHARTLYEEMLQVPLLIHLPGGPRISFAGPVESIDLVPTLLGQLGLPVDPRMRGRDLLRGPLPRITTHGGVHTLSTSKWAARTPDLKLIVTTPTREEPPGLQMMLREQLAELGYIDQGLPARTQVELYDLREDPGEQDNLWSRLDQLPPAQQERLRELQEELNAGSPEATPGQPKEAGQ